MRYEYNISYYALGYIPEHNPEIVTVDALPTAPDPVTILNNTDHLAEMQILGEQGWELVTVVPTLRGCYNEGAGYGYSLTAGYFLYWRRVKP